MNASVIAPVKWQKNSTYPFENIETRTYVCAKCVGVRTYKQNIKNKKRKKKLFSLRYFNICEYIHIDIYPSVGTHTHTQTHVYTPTHTTAELVSASSGSAKRRLP